MVLKHYLKQHYVYPVLIVRQGRQTVTIPISFNGWRSLRYQARKPDYINSLEDALRLAGKIDLDRTNDPETVALAGSIEKHLFEENQGDEHLDKAILLYQRGYYLLHNRHNGINLAYLLHLRVHYQPFSHAR